MTEPPALFDAEEILEAVRTRRHDTYPAYKPSGVEWLGDVPEHWDVKSLKWDSPVLRGASPRPIDDPVYFDDGGEFAWVRIADVTAAGTYLRETTQRLSELGASLSVKLEPGDLFLSIAGSVGKPCITKIKCCIHDGFVYFPRLSCERMFLYYIFASGEPYKGLGKLGTQLNLNTETVGSIRMAFPPLEEQRAIARFLDEQTEKIDDLISAKRDLLALLKEKRQAVITHAVTRGLDPAAKLKPSGVEWLGAVPEPWDVKRLKFLVHLVNAKVEAHEETKSTYIGMEHIESWTGKLRLPDDVFVPSGISNAFRSGDVLFGKLRPYLAKATTIDFGGLCSSELIVLRSEELDRHFLLYTLLSDGFIKLVNSSTYGSKMPRANWEFIGGMYTPVPPIEEQRAIARFLDEETEKMDDLESVVREAIASLELLRTSIISAAVTGKIDVRSATVQTKP